MFALILIISIAGGLFLKRLRLHFWPARSINLLFISLGTFGMMIVSSFFSLINLTKISIFPILFMIILAEDFVRTQLVNLGNFGVGDLRSFDDEYQSSTGDGVVESGNSGTASFGD